MNCCFEMPIYDLKNKETGEERLNELMSIADRDKFLTENPDWEQMVVLPRDQWLLSDRMEIHRRAGTEWQDVLKKIKKNNMSKHTNINV